MNQSTESSLRFNHLTRIALAVVLLLATLIPARGQQQTAQPGRPTGQQPATSTQQAAPPLPSTPPSTQAQQQPVNRLALDEAVRLAGAQASNFQQARLAEMIAAEDVRQARLAFLPRVVSTLAHTYNSPALGPHPAGAGREMSFINANAITEYEALVGIAGDLDIAGRLRATLGRNVALLEAARAGTEVARRALVQGVNESYYGLALATARRLSAEQSLRAAEEFEHVARLLLDAGEVADVDLTRARLLTATRQDELEQARAAESAAADSLRVLVGYDFTRPIETAELALAPPDISELDRFTDATITRRPEFAQFDAERSAARQEVKIARAERMPQVSYFVNGGFDTDSLARAPLKMHTGVLASVSVTIPIFDWGASRSRERQARLREQTASAERELALRSFAQQFYTARAQAISAARRVGILQASVADAERNVKTSVDRYRAGEAPILEVTDAETTLAAQRAALFQALFDYRIARARLAQAAGE